MRPRRSSHGFTLVELLVVIAIIGILAGLIAAVLPRALERARIANATNNFTQIRTILMDYYTKYDSFPPMHGYLSDGFKGDNFVAPDTILNAVNGGVIPEDVAFFIAPWDDRIEIHGNEDLYDTFSEGYDADRNGSLSQLEFAPRGELVPGGGGYTFDNYTEVYNLIDTNNATTLGDVDYQVNSFDRRPYIYVAVNSRQARLFRDIMYDEAIANGNGSNPRPFNLSANAIARINEMTFPPPRYDAAVLISVGPDLAGGTAGIVPEFGVNGFMNASDVSNLVYRYHVLGLAAHFMATRDSENQGEGDGLLDFDFLARTRSGGGKNFDNDLPKPGAERRAGPLIYIVNK